MLLTNRLCVSTTRVKIYRQHGVPIDWQKCYWRANSSSSVVHNHSTHLLHISTGTSQQRLQQRHLPTRANTSLNISTRHVSTRTRNEDLLPVSCPGCGALTQEVKPNEPGYYSRSRKAVKAYIKAKRYPGCQDGHSDVSGALDEEAVSHQSTSGHIDPNVLEEAERVAPSLLKPMATVQYPVCDRCHDLIYNSKGQSIAHPSVDDIADSIAESPFKHNHVYHVLDAADFPMSLFPKIFENLELAKPRSQNRRARHRFSTRPSISFIITRSDLLAPTKEMVDKMLPYFRGILRRALGRVGRDMRLGNVHLVSAKRGWWTTDIKENIWKRGGGNWMVGRVNVGKSNLFEVLFPKGSGDRAPVYAELEEAQASKTLESASSGLQTELDAPSQDFLPEDSLLPPPQPEVRFPTMPIVSSLPGTTASPIRLSFGGHRGELIDLPGLERGSLEEFVRPEHRLDLVMQYRPNVQQHVIKPGQSLLLGGGLVRITPQLDENDPSTTVLAYPFTPIEAHVTSTEKAIAAQGQERQSGIKSILADGAGPHMISAGTFQLDTDVTKTYAGPLVRAGVSVTKLAFAIYSTDILIEGVGWVELVCQIRKPRNSRLRAMDERSDFQSSGKPLTNFEQVSASDTHPTFQPFAKETVSDDTTMSLSRFHLPRVEIFSPHGKHVGHRPPLGAWVVWDEGRKRRINTSISSKRTRKPMAGVKKQVKLAAKARTNGTDVAA